MRHVLSSVLRSKRARTSAHDGLNASAASPASGVTSVDNSQGASKALAELSHGLGEALELIDLEGDIRGQLQLRLDDLDSKASSYLNVSIACCPTATPWEGDPTQLELVAAAWDCAARVYERYTPVVSPEAVQYTPLAELESSASGNVKETTFTLVTPTLSQPVLVVAVRGSFSKIDHVVNLHGESRDAGALLKNKRLTEGREAFGGEASRAHAGFLNCFTEVKDEVWAKVEQFLSEDPGQHILFTGHSAGGALASLLAMYCRGKTRGKNYSTVSCITFGSPPVARLFDEDSDIQDLLHDADSVVINFVNEYDLVARADRAYIGSLVDLYNTPAQTNKQQAYGSLTQQEKQTPQSLWPLPEQDLHHIGQIVVLKMELPRDELTGERVVDARPRLSAWNVSAEEFSRLLFCRLAVHKRAWYRDRISQLCNGKSIDSMGYQ